MTTRPRTQPVCPAVAGVSPALDQLHRLAIALLRAVRVEDDAAGIGPALLSALSVLTFVGPLAMGALAAAEGVRAPTMSRLVDALERRGLARRTVDPADARRVRVEVSPRGRALLLAGRARRLRRLQRAACALTGRDRRAISASLPAIFRLVIALRELPAPTGTARPSRRRFD